MSNCKKQKPRQKWVQTTSEMGTNHVRNGYKPRQKWVQEKYKN